MEPWGLYAASFTSPPRHFMAWQARKALHQMEGRKQQANVRLNEAHTRTRTLKASIDDMRREKLACEDLLRKLAAATTAQRTNLAAMLKSVHAANLARDRVRLLLCFGGHIMLESHKGYFDNGLTLLLCTACRQW